MRVILVAFLIGIFSCKSHKKSVDAKKLEFTPQYVPGPQALVYKTKADYQNLVPVILSDDKLEIISYPDPKDVAMNPVPTQLNKGYLLDNRGIGINVAYLKLTYPEYANLKALPSLKELYTLIIDKDPLLELCDCGNKTALKKPSLQLNTLIDSKKLRTTCKPIK
ncbi:MAG: hypothetical protein NTX03_08900 [Bacteroidetes bacterium]|nr:hypothetical protein [Bacteroidota bacterium]